MKFTHTHTKKKKNNIILEKCLEKISKANAYGRTSMKTLVGKL